MCKQHILGEHAETHSFLKKMEQGHSLAGFIEGSMFFGAAYVEARHNLLVPFIAGHFTPLKTNKILRARYPLLTPSEKDVTKSISTLINRCEDCARLYL